MAGTGYFADAPDDVRPKPVRVLRALLWTDAAITAVMLVAGVLAVGLSVPVAAQLAVMAWPGAVAGVAAWRVSDSRTGLGRGWFTCLLVAAIWQVAVAVSELLGGDPRGFTSLLLPLAITVLSVSGPVRTYLRSAVAPDARGDTGAGMAEYAGLIVLAALILGSLVALGLPSQITTGTGTALCRVFSSDADCSGTARRENSTPRGADPTADTPNGGDPNAGNPNAGKRNDDLAHQIGRGFKPCKGFLDCAWKGIQTDPYDATKNVPCDGVLGCVIRGAGLLASSQYNLDKAILEDGKGIVDLATDPASIIDAGKYIWQHPGDALRQLVWDDESAKLWKNGNYVGAVSRTIWNIGSWFIPGVDIGKALSKAGKFAKLAKLADKTGKLGKLGKLARASKAASDAADKAERLAAKGDAKGARAAANEAKRNADAAARQARKDGCAVALPLHAVRISPRFGRFGAAALPACAMGEPEGVRKAREAAKRAEKQAERAGKAFVPAPKKLNPKAFPGTRRVAEKTSRQGGGSLRRRWKDGKGNIYEWDYQHGAVEKYNKRGRHLGEYDPRTGEQTKPADPSRHVDP